ncbi:hypothetical protein IEQ34_001069 [Dendrobium chrysotoxum]|uniref:Uncharacterized protein n=1 Tax=Dendrobium chrysotoxum TaxID=161865 RepID=A0AAV7HKL3_DENCH|nr:hypothetical protein IEQ34_001069 [Dendrobium chrysotoxum]
MIGAGDRGKRWWRRWRWRRKRGWVAMALVCFSPVLLPLFCLSFPLLCIAAFCLRFTAAEAQGGRRRRRDGAVEAIRCVKRGRRDAIRSELLHRYLEDQMTIAASVVDFEGDGDASGHHADGGKNDDEPDQDAMVLSSRAIMVPSLLSKKIYQPHLIEEFLSVAMGCFVQGYLVDMCDMVAVARIGRLRQQLEQDLGIFDVSDATTKSVLQTDDVQAMSRIATPVDR